jgi:hypothetical protein
MRFNNSGEKDMHNSGFERGIMAEGGALGEREEQARPERGKERELGFRKKKLISQ